MINMRRREFITLFGGLAMAWPRAARAQQPERMRRIGVLMVGTDGADSQGRVAAFRQGLQEVGWSEGRNLLITSRWSAGDNDSIQAAASNLVELRPDVLLVNGRRGLVALQQETPIVPIVFADPVEPASVASLARPGGNITGFTPFEYSTSAKWLELLKAIAPGVTRVAVNEEPNNPGAVGQVAAIKSAAPAFGVEVIAFNGRDAGEIARAMAVFAQSPNGGLIVPAIPSANIHRDFC